MTGEARSTSTSAQSSYPTSHAYFRDLDRLLAEGATLRDLFDAARTVAQPSWADEQDPAAVDISIERRRLLASHEHFDPEFLPLRLHELYGGLEIPHDDDYVLMMIAGLSVRGSEAADARDSIRGVLLRQDHDLRESVFWRIFEVEGGGEVSLTNLDKFTPDHLSWRATVLALADDGLLERRRLLRSSLQALNRDFSSFRAGWFSRLYTALAPTVEEAAAEQSLLRGCLGSGIQASVTLAAKQLVAIHRAGLLEAEEFAPAIVPAMTGSKSAVQGLLRILHALLGAERVGKEEATEALLEALAHPHVDVQRTAVAMVLELDREDLVREQQETIAPAVLAELLPEGEQEPDDSSEQIDASPEQTDAAGTCPDALPSARSLRRWSDADAAERFSALLENPGDTLELELALAWLAAAEQAPALLAPLAPRASAVDRGHDRFLLVELLRAVLGIDTEFLPRPHVHPDPSETGGEEVPCDSERVVWLLPEEDGSALPALLTRMREVVAIVQGRTPRRTLLATPTDTLGWIDAETLLDRAAENSREAAPGEADVHQALLRVRPEDRERVRSALGAGPEQATTAARIQWTQRTVEHETGGSVETDSWWEVDVVTDVPAPSPVHPALIATTTERAPQERRSLDAVVIGQLGLVSPGSTLPLIPGILELSLAGDGEADSTRHALQLLDVLRDHPGAWSAETVQLVALGIAAKDAAVHTVAAEVLAAAVPSRIAVPLAAQGFADCAQAVILTRWATGLADAAALAPGPVLDLLTALLPLLDPGMRGIGKLLGLLQEESLRQHREANDPELRDWLGEFTGSSAAACSARALLRL